MKDIFIRSGDTIRAGFLNDIVKQIQDNTAAINQLRSDFEAIEEANDQKMALPGLIAGGAMPTSLTFAESSRNYVSVTITDSTGDTHTVQIATQIIMSASDAGQTYSWTFQFASG